MKPLAAALPAAALLCLMPSATAASWQRAKPDGIVAPTGLVEVRVRGFRRSFVQPGAALGTPRPVCIAMGEFSFDENWPRKVYGRSLQPEDLRDVQTKFNAAVQKEFEKAFRNQGGYTLAASSESCAARIVVSLRDVYLNAPEPMASGSTKTYARSVGHMGLRIDVFDPGGAVLQAQAHAFRADPDSYGVLNPDEILNETNRITELDNLEFARDTARRFAEYTRTRLFKNYPRG
jgi:hypothetical protein